MVSFLEEAFSHFGRGATAHVDQAGSPDRAFLAKAVERVVDETSPRLRAVPGYKRRLEGPVTDAFLHIDELVEDMPAAILCSRSAFSADPRVRSFFVNPQQMQEVFSQNRDVRDLFDVNPQAEECYALVCMHMEERHKFGMDLAGDSVHKEVLQTAVSFTDHQVYTPGVSEKDARRALKCCIFGGILKYIREKLIDAKTRDFENRKRLSMLRSQLRKAHQRSMTDKQEHDLQAQIEDLEDAIKQAALHPTTLQDCLALVTEMLHNTDQFVSASFQQLQLSHMGIKVGRDTRQPVNVIDITEIRIASREPRVAVLVRIPQCELLPKAEFLLNSESYFFN